MVPRQAPAHPQHAAAEVGIISGHIAGDKLILAGLQQPIAERLAAADGGDFALVQRHAEQIRRVDFPLHVADRVDTVALKQNGEEVFIRPGHVGDADGLSLQALEAAERRVFGRQQVQTAAVGPGGELDVKALLQRLQPAQRHPHPGVGLAGGDRLQQHIGGVAEVNKLNVEVIFTENLLLLGDGDRREAYRAFVDRQLDLVGLWQAQRRMGIAAGHVRHIMSPQRQRDPGQRQAAAEL